MSLYCMVFDEPIQSQEDLINALKVWDVTDISQGPTDYSIEFRAEDDDWSKTQWEKWESWIAEILKHYNFNPQRSCLPYNLVEKKEDENDRSAYAND